MIAARENIPVGVLPINDSKVTDANLGVRPWAAVMSVA
jgi:hypothetical protein